MVGKKYNHKKVEKNRYNWWLEKDLFKSGDLDKEPFSIVIPPPNVTGKLHLGHAWDTTLQDIIIRYKRMDGFDALWLPGMDHAGIATQAKVDEKLRKQGIIPREMTREQWFKHAWSWKDEYAQNIRKQWGKLGLSLDYKKERFTLDEGLNNAVNEVFVELYKKGLIYRGERIINWDPEAKTALSNEEVIHKDIEGFFYHIKYKLENSENYLEVATTRPETIFGDTAVAVNKKDERYKDLVGRKVHLPISNKLVPIIEDDYVDMDFGSGVVKITPAHDPNDFEVGNRHNLERINILNKDGTLNENAFHYNKLDRFEARKKLIKELKSKNLLIKEEKYTHSVGHSERTNAIVEPYLSKQWFVKMRPLADRVLENQKNKDSKVNFIPKRYEKIMNHWMEITYDWCISRQLWWGHQIPAWYRGEETYVGKTPPEGKGWIRDKDVLDTWFSSGLWPFSTLGWPNKSDLLDRYYPNNVLVTGYDIIPFWVNRMTFQGLEFTNQRPFKDCLIHGLIRDEKGRKMSKSLGNGVDPMDVIEKYGADALRYFLTTTTAPGQDLRYEEEKVKSTWNFINKIWNASRYVLMNIENLDNYDFEIKDLNTKDKWILSKLNKTIKNVRKHMEKYEFNNVNSYLYSFIWNDYCDWYIELSKSDMSITNKKVLLSVLNSIIKMLHPFMPYVTEEIYQMIPNKKESIMIDDFPKYLKEYKFINEEKEIEELIDIIKTIRNAKLEYNFKEFVILENKFIMNHKENIEGIFKNKKIIKKDIKDLEVINFPKFTLAYIYGLNEEEIKESLLKEKESLEDSIKRRKNLLDNENYVNKAPKNVVLKDKEKLKEEESKLNSLKERLK